MSDAPQKKIIPPVSFRLPPEVEDLINTT
jgi:hypothetical protein